MNIAEGENLDSGTFDLFGEVEMSGVDEVHFPVDPNTRMRAIVAIHSTREAYFEAFGTFVNQLAHGSDAALLRRHQILYAPDYVINAGGLTHLALPDAEQRDQKILGIHDTLLEIVNQTRATDRSTRDIADEMARERFRARAGCLSGSPVWANGGNHAP